MADSQLIYNCPGCGKPTTASQGGLTNRCQYCGLVARIGAPETVFKYFYPSKVDTFGARMAADRFLKENQLPLTGNIIRAEFYYLPFYRFRGMALDYIASTVAETKPITGEGEIDESVSLTTKLQLKGKDFDVTIPGVSEIGFGMISLGIRPVAVPLYGFCPTDISRDAIIIGSDISAAEIPAKATDLHRTNLGLYNKGRAIYSAMIGEQLSVIYFPIWALTHQVGGQEKTVFVDALAKRGYQQSDSAFKFGGSRSAGQNSQFITPMRHQCPNCGQDLEEKPFSLFYPCSNCRRAYLLDKNGYRQVAPQVAVAANAPFWRFKLELAGKKTYKTVKDFSELLVSEPAFLRKEKRDRQFYLYSPAFFAGDVNRWTEMALRIVKSQPHDELVEGLPAVGPDVCVEEKEAKQMAAFLWDIATAKYLKLKKAGFQVDENILPPGEIIWLPLQDEVLLSKSRNFRQVNVVSK